MAIIPEMITNFIGVGIIVAIYAVNYIKAKKVEDPSVAVERSS